MTVGVWAPTGVRLEADGLAPLVLDESNGWEISGIDLGYPAVRRVAGNRPDADGTVDTTRYFGARAVTLQLEAWPGVYSLFEMTQQLRAFMSPRLSPILYFTLADGAPEQRMVLSPDGVSQPIVNVWQQLISVQWVCPSGIIESADLNAVTAGAGGEVAQTGLTFDATPDFSFGGATVASGGALVTNVGNVPVWPTVYMFGPFSAGTVLRNDTTDQELAFLSTMSIVAGDYLVVDFAAKTIKNSTGTSYYDSLDFPASTWWQLQPGENRIYMLPTTFTAPPASFTIEYRDGWL